MVRMESCALKFLPFPYPESRVAPCARGMSRRILSPTFFRAFPLAFFPLAFSLLAVPHRAGATPAG